MTCVCGHEHEWTEPQVCKDIDCKCQQYREATEQNTVLSKHESYIRHMDSVMSQVAWILDNIAYLRNSKNKDFVDFYFDNIRVFTPRGRDPVKPDYESVRRAKQKLVREMPLRYGPYNPDVIQEKAEKQIAIEEFVTQ